MSKCVVTGGCGFIGGHLVDKLILDGHSVIVIDDLSAPENDYFHFNNSAEYIREDISKIDCSDAFEGVDHVFHLAARSRIQPTIDNPGRCFEVNLIGTQRVLEWSRKNHVKKLIYSGTSSLYGHQNSIPFTPNMPTDCLNPYSMSKWMGEQVCKLYYQLYGFSSICLRYFNVYGPREPLKGQYAPVIGLFKRQIKNNKPMTIVGDGEQRRDFTYIEDVISANILASISDINFGIYNVGTGKNYSINQISCMLGKDKIFISERQAEVRETLADIDSTISDLGWRPAVRISDIINEY